MCRVTLAVCLPPVVVTSPALNGSQDPLLVVYVTLYPTLSAPFTGAHSTEILVDVVPVTVTEVGAEGHVL